MTKKTKYEVRHYPYRGGSSGYFEVHEQGGTYVKAQFWYKGREERRNLRALSKIFIAHYLRGVEVRWK